MKNGTTQTKRRQPLSQGSAALLMVGLGTAALIGLPGFSDEVAPEGLLEGVLSDPQGAAVEGAPVALFDGRSNALLEITHTDSAGRFGFQQDPGKHHVYAAAPENENWIGAWSLDRESGMRQVDLKLAAATLFEARVQDSAGQPITGAEVRVYSKSTNSPGLGVLARARTDAKGSAWLFAPVAAHVGAFSTDLRHRADWHFDQSFGKSNTRLEFTLEVGHPVHGTVVDEDGRPLSDVVVNSWEAGADLQQWNGYQVTGRNGTFLFYGGSAGTLLRATDLTQSMLPTERLHSGPGDIVLVLSEGNSQSFQCTNGAGNPQESILWAWSESSKAWSWGAQTDSTGHIEAALDDNHSVVIDALGESADRSVKAFGRSFSPGPLQVAFDHKPVGSTTSSRPMD